MALPSSRRAIFRLSSAFASSLKNSFLRNHEYKFRHFSYASNKTVPSFTSHISERLSTPQGLFSVASILGLAGAGLFMDSFSSDSPGHHAAPHHFPESHSQSKSISDTHEPIITQDQLIDDDSDRDSQNSASTDEKNENKDESKTDILKKPESTALSGTESKSDETANTQDQDELQKSATEVLQVDARSNENEIPHQLFASDSAPSIEKRENQESDSITESHQINSTSSETEIKDLPHVEVGTKSEVEPEPKVGAENPIQDDTEVEPGTDVDNETEVAGDNEVMEECGFCRFMKAGPCGSEFSEWEACTKIAEENGKDIVEECMSKTEVMKSCIESHPEYYAIVIEAGEKMSQEAEAQAANEAAAADSPQMKSLDGKNGEETEAVHNNDIQSSRTTIINEANDSTSGLAVSVGESDLVGESLDPSPPVDSSTYPPSD